MCSSPPDPRPRRTARRLGAIAATVVVGAAAAQSTDWPAYLGDKGRTLFSPLRQIDRTNVAKLEVAWTFETGDKGEFQSNNLVIDGIVYTASPARKVIAKQLSVRATEDLVKKTRDPESVKPKAPPAPVAKSASADFQLLEPAPYATFDEIKLDAWLTSWRAHLAVELKFAPELVLPSRVMKEVKTCLETEGAGAIHEALDGYRRALVEQESARFCANRPPPV